jgi:Peptidase C13 family
MMSSSDQVNTDPTNTHLSWTQWLALGTRLCLFMPITLAPRSSMRAWQFLSFVLVSIGLDIALSRLTVPGAAYFYGAALPMQWSTFVISAVLVWLAVEHGSEPSSAAWMHTTGAARVGTILGLVLSSSFIYILFSFCIGIAIAHAKSTPWAYPLAWLGWASYWLTLMWSLLIALRIYQLMGLRVRPAVALACCLTALSVMIQTFLPWQLWYPNANESAAAEPAPMRLNQALFESQTQLLKTQLSQIQAQRPEQQDMYAVIYAPYAPEDVFLKESRMVEQVLSERFNSAGRIVSLVNNTQTTQTHAWASPENLQRSIQAMAAQMNHEEDVLLVYLTSHGAKDFKLASAHWPLATDDLTPQHLAQMLAQAGIKHRVIAVSACYSGGWIEPLKTDHSLIMTAADATHTSYGCGTRSELTFFGRAVFSEGLRSGASFEQAFAQAVPVIKKREEEAGKDDGFSNPQIFVSEGIKPLLSKMQQLPASVKSP